MKFLKGLLLTVLSLLLFLSLSVFGIAFILNSTLLNPGFAARQVEKLDVSSLVREVVEMQFGEQLTQGAEFLEEAINKVISDQEPWLKEQVTAAIYSGYDYFLGKTERLSLIVSLESLKDGMRESLWEFFMQSLPPQLSGLPTDQLEPYFEQYYQEYAAQIPSEFEFDESSLDADTLATIREIRQGIGYFQLGYNILIGFMVLLVLAIILINRNVRGSTRELGITLLIYGALEFATVFLARNYTPSSLPFPSGIPATLETWLLGLSADLLTPLQTFSIGVLVGGVVLLIVSFVYPRREVEED